MELSVFSSDSDDSDLEVLAQLSDWDTDNSDAADAEVRQRASSRRIRRVNYMQTLDDAEFTFRFSNNFTPFYELQQKLCLLFGKRLAFHLLKNNCNGYNLVTNNKQIRREC